MPESQAAVAMVRALEPCASVLLIRRAEREGDPWSGHWSFPGGRCEPEDPDLLHTALRELEEECGIRLGREHLETAMPPSLAGRRAGRFLQVAPFLFRVERQLPVVLDACEAVEARWISLASLADLGCHALQPVPGMPVEMYFPGIPLNQVPLWGFTYRLIAQWLGLGGLSGFETARLMLDSLVAQGLELQQDWQDAAAENAMKVAAVKGSVPPRFLENAALPGRCVPAVSVIEVRPDSIRVVGQAFEEYLIQILD